MKTKRGQVLGMPFSMMFSIILIIFFIIAAFVAIKIFWNPNACALSDRAQEGMFKQDLQDSVNEAWNSGGADMPFKINLPGKIEYLCFINSESPGKGDFSGDYEQVLTFGSDNTHLFPGGKACEGFASFQTEHINITEITKENNPYCIKNGKDARIIFTKGLVIIK